jgi:zinc transporter ZupT
MYDSQCLLKELQGIAAFHLLAGRGACPVSLVTVLSQGLSEPLGALIALLFVKPFLTPLLLQYMLAFVGGIMVCHAQQTLVSFLRLLSE